MPISKFCDNDIQSFVHNSLTNIEEEHFFKTFLKFWTICFSIFRGFWRNIVLYSTPLFLLIREGLIAGSTKCLTPKLSFLAPNKSTTNSEPSAVLAHVYEHKSVCCHVPLCYKGDEWGWIMIERIVLYLIWVVLGCFRCFHWRYCLY